MSIKNNYLYTDSYAKRHIIQIDMLDEEDAEAKVFLSSLLSSFPKLEKRADFASLADLNISFKLVHRGDSYALISSLVQVEHPALRYIFSDPYKRGVELQREIISSGYDVDNLSFENLKSDLIYQTKVDDHSSIHLLKSALSCLYSSPFLDVDKLRNITASQVMSEAETYQKNSCGDLLYLGKELKKELPVLLKYDKPLPLVEGTCTLSGYNTINGRYLQDEAVAYVLEIPRKLSSFKELDVLETFLRALVFDYQNYCLTRLGTETSATIDYIDSTHPVLIFSTGRNRGDYLGRQSFLNIDAPIPEHVRDSFSESVLYNEEKRLNLQLDENMILKRFLIAHAFGLEGEDFLSILDDDELLEDYLEGTRVRAIVVASRGEA